MESLELERKLVNQCIGLPSPLQNSPYSRLRLARLPRGVRMARRAYEWVHQGKGAGVGEGKPPDA